MWWEVAVGEGWLHDSHVDIRISQTPRRRSRISPPERDEVEGIRPGFLTMYDMRAAGSPANGKNSIEPCS